MFNKNLPQEAPGTLVIIGMQAEFTPARAEQTLDAVELLLIRRLYDGWNIVLVERGPIGQNCPTLPQLTRWLDDYPRVERLEILQDDAGQAIADACKRRRFTTRYVDVAGVNTSELITDSVLTLSRALAQTDASARIYVHTRACNDSVPNDFTPLQGMWMQVPRPGNRTQTVVTNINLVQ